MAGLAPERWRPVDQGERLESVIAPNTPNRNFVATAPDQKWVADFTCVWTKEGWLYVAAVLDLFSRRIGGWSMKTRMSPVEYEKRAKLA